MSIWDKLSSWRERYTLAHWFIVTLVFLLGFFFNHGYRVYTWATLPYDQQKDITILFEKTEELKKFMEAVKDVQKDLKDGEKDINIIKHQIEGLNLELKTQVKRLDDGQLQLFLKTERLDERTSENIHQRGKK